MKGHLCMCRIHETSQVISGFVEALLVIEVWHCEETNCIECLMGVIVAQCFDFVISDPLIVGF